MILANGVEITGVLFDARGEDGLTPVNALMCPTDPAGWQFLGLLASTVVNRLGKLAVDTATGDQDSASATWWLSLHGTPDHAPTRAKAKEAFAQPETPLGRSPSRRGRTHCSGGRCRTERGRRRGYRIAGAGGT